MGSIMLAVQSTTKLFVVMLIFNLLESGWGGCPNRQLHRDCNFSMQVTIDMATTQKSDDDSARPMTMGQAGSNSSSNTSSSTSSTSSRSRKQQPQQQQQQQQQQQLMVGGKGSQPKLIAVTSVLLGAACGESRRQLAKLHR